MMSTRQLLIAALLGWCTGLIAQPLDEVPVKMMIETAEASLAIPDPYTALEWYENAYKETRDPELALKIADLNYTLRDFGRAEKWYERIVQKDQGEKFPEAVFRYAQTLKINGSYDDAVEAFNFFAGLNVNDSLLALADNEVAGIQLAVQSKPPIDLVVKNVGKTINYSFTDASPWLDPQGKLYYASMRTREIITLDGKEGDYYLKIYSSEKGKDGQWETPKPLDNKINREGYHTGNPSISPDGSRMFFTRSQLTGNNLSESKIFVSISKGGNWGAPIELTGVNGNYMAKHPAVGYLFGKEVLFFAADIPGGEGGFDLYYAERETDETYSLPVNLGPMINTSLDDVSPFFLNNQLYYSSLGHPGLGGFDIFRAAWDGQAWSKPENMGAGYNTSYDDIFFSVNESGKLGFLVSNRPDADSRSLKSKTCCDDIYQFQIRDIKLDLLASVYEGEKPLLGVKMTMFEMDRGRTGKSVMQVNDQINDFQFPLEQDKTYKVLVEKDGYMPGEFEINTIGLIENTTIKRIIKLARLAPEKENIEIVTINEPIRLNNIYYDFDDDKILPDAETDLNFLLGLMKKYPDMVIELASHTDAQGNDAYNDALSLRRAQSAKKWLVSRGIGSNRIEAVGYGEQYILNHCINGIQCSDEEHRINRRTEFKIIAGPTTIEVQKSDIGDQRHSTGNIRQPQVIGKGTTPSGTPKVELTWREKMIDLGAVKKGDKREMSFQFTNTGNQPIEIELVSSCECTTLEYPQFRTFKPGEKGGIRATFDSGQKDDSETIDVEVILRQSDPKTGNPITYLLQYKYNLVK